MDLTQYDTPKLMELYSSVQHALLGRGVKLPVAGVEIETSNYKKAQAALTAKGYTDFHWVDEDKGADFTALHPTGRVRIQLKSRVGFWRKYIGNDVKICGVTDDGIYLYPHDRMLEKCAHRFQHCRSWIEGGEQYWPKRPAWVRDWLAPYKLREAAS
jgi:hypothetical protein